MKVIGIILLVVGAILFYGAKIIYKKNEKKTFSYNLNNSNDNEEFLALVSNAVIVVRIIGALLVVVGAVFIILLS